MNTDISKFTAMIKRKQPASISAIKMIEKDLHINFPEDYVDWLLESNGGSGFVGENAYLILWSLEQIITFNESYRRLEIHIPGLVLFGSDGGEERYAFNTKSQPMTIVEISVENPNVIKGRPIGVSFADFLRNLAHR